MDNRNGNYNSKTKREEVYVVDDNNTNDVDYTNDNYDDSTNYTTTKKTTTYTTSDNYDDNYVEPTTKTTRVERNTTDRTYVAPRDDNSNLLWALLGAALLALLLYTLLGPKWKTTTVTTADQTVTGATVVNTYTSTAPANTAAAAVDATANAASATVQAAGNAASVAGQVVGNAASATVDAAGNAVSAAGAAVSAAGQTVSAVTAPAGN